MITREEAIRRLEEVEREISGLKKALEGGWGGTLHKDPTQGFLDKCGGWEDTRSPEKIIADIYDSRTSSGRGKALFSKASS